MAYVIAELEENFNAYCTLRLIHVISGWTTTGASYLTLAAVSIDRFLAVTLHLRYNMIVTVPRVFIAVCVLWITCITGVLLRFWLSNWITYALGVMILTFFVTALSALKIFQIVRRHLRQIHGQNTAGNFPTNTVNAIKCRKSAVTVLYVSRSAVGFLPSDLCDNVCRDIWWIQQTSEDCLHLRCNCCLYQLLLESTCVLLEK